MEKNKVLYDRILQLLFKGIISYGITMDMIGVLLFPQDDKALEKLEQQINGYEKEM